MKLDLGSLCGIIMAIAILLGLLWLSAVGVYFWYLTG